MNSTSESLLWPRQALPVRLTPLDEVTPLKATSAPTATTATRIAFCIVCPHNCSLPGESPWLRTMGSQTGENPNQVPQHQAYRFLAPRFSSPTRSAEGTPHIAQRQPYISHPE